MDTFTPNYSNNKANNLNKNYGVNYSLSNTFLEYDNQTQTFIIATINNNICKIALGLQNCLYLNDLLIDTNNCQDYSQKIDLLNQFLRLQTHQYLSNLDITLRQFITLTFANLGIEVAYSGKKQYEKGVIIDVDEDVAQKWGLNLQALKQGQTVVKLVLN